MLASRMCDVITYDMGLQVLVIHVLEPAFGRALMSVHSCLSHVFAIISRCLEHILHSFPAGFFTRYISHASVRFGLQLAV